jgi:hypothetical protein
MIGHVKMSTGVATVTSWIPWILATMTSSEGLPLDLLPQILAHLSTPDHVASLCLVNRPFYLFSVPNLYRRIVILPRHKAPESRVCSLFQKEMSRKITDMLSLR